MNHKLEQITNLTINNLLNNKIILPSSYFEKFNYYAKEIEINLDIQVKSRQMCKIATYWKHMNKAYKKVAQIGFFKAQATF